MRPIFDAGADGQPQTQGNRPQPFAHFAGTNLTDSP